MSQSAQANQTQSRALDAQTGTGVLEVDQLKRQDLEDLARATVEAIADGADLDWRTSPGIASLEAYWKGILLAPHRSLIVARLDGRICGCVQVIRPSSINETGSFAAKLSTLFVAPFARGQGLARELAMAAEERAKEQGFYVLDLVVRADREAALKLVGELGYELWATKKLYALRDGVFLSGHYFTKTIRPLEGLDL